MLWGRIKWSVGGSPTFWQTHHVWLNQPFGSEPPPFHFRFQPCALRCGITIYTQIKDLDKWIRLPQPFVQPETEHGVSPPYPLFPLP